MKQHQYRITLDYVADTEGKAVDAQPLIFNAPNHDDILAIVHSMGERSGLNPNDTARFVVGLKLMSEVMLENKENTLFAALKPHFSGFMKELKKG